MSSEVGMHGHWGWGDCTLGWVGHLVSLAHQMLVASPPTPQSLCQPLMPTPFRSPPGVLENE